MQKASESIASLWLFHLETISSATGIEMFVLCNCLNLPVPVATVPEKKKRAPAKKKESVVVVVAPLDATEDTEVATEVPPPPAEKKKRAPAKKKEAVVVVVAPPSDDGEVATEVPAEKKKRAPAKKKEAVVVDVAPLDDTIDATEVPKAPAEKKKRAPAKKKEAVVSSEDADSDTEKGAKNAKAKKTGKKTNMKINDDEEVSCSGNTVIMPPDRIDVEEVFIGATSFLVAENNTAYLKSSRQPVGKYDPEQKTIHPHIDDEDDEEDDERDECPVLSDMSDDE